MGFSDLEQGSLIDYIDRLREKSDHLWFFLHIPKTAGSSFSSELAARCRPYRNVHIDYADTTTPHQAQISNAVDRFIAEMATQHFGSASGHVPFHLVRRILEAKLDTQVVTFLRAPEARVISDFRYQRTPMHPPYQTFIQEFPTIESYIESPQSQNKIAKFVYGTDRTCTVEELTRHAGEKFAFIGLLEMYPMSFNSIFAAMGHPGLAPSEHKRKTPDTKSTEVEITPAIRGLIRETNRLDQALYKYVRNILQRHREEWLANRKGPTKVTS